jgi:hypothetical protein
MSKGYADGSVVPFIQQVNRPPNKPHTVSFGHTVTQAPVLNQQDYRRYQADPLYREL